MKTSEDSTLLQNKYFPHVYVYIQSAAAWFHRHLAIKLTTHSARTKVILTLREPNTVLTVNQYTLSTYRSPTPVTVTQTEMKASSASHWFHVSSLWNVNWADDNIRCVHTSVITHAWMCERFTCSTEPDCCSCRVEGRSGSVSSAIGCMHGAGCLSENSPTRWLNNYMADKRHHQP